MRGEGKGRYVSPIHTLDKIPKHLTCMHSVYHVLRSFRHKCLFMCLRTAARQLFGVEVPPGPLPLKTLRNADFQVGAVANTRGRGGGR